MTARVRAQLVEAAGVFGVRVTHNGQVFRTKVHMERVTFYRRVEELRALLEVEGWTVTETGRQEHP